MAGESSSRNTTSGNSPADHERDDGYEVIRKNPDLHISQLAFLVSNPDYDPKLKKEAHTELLALIKKHDMAPYYRKLCADLGTPIDEKLVACMEERNAETLKEMEDKIADAIENFGESEVREAWLRKAEYLCEIGDKEAAVTAFRHTNEKTVGMGNRIDLVFYQIRLGLFFLDNHLVSTNLAKAHTLMEQGGDWDRKNRLKAYEGLYKMSVRDFEGAAALFLDAVSTFTSTELITYKELIFYTVLTAVFALDRPAVRDKVVKGAEIQEELHSMPELKAYLQTLYDCEYAAFFQSLAWIEHKIKYDRYTAPHYAYYARGMRIKAYKQLLQSYRSLSLQSMANEFGVSVEWLDRELMRLIAAGAVHCRIDAVHGIVETNEQDSKNYQYQTLIRDGDIILNRVQKLARVING